MEKIPFIKMNGCGNDFIVVDNRQGIIKEYDLPEFIRRVCTRRVSVGADGFMMLEESDKADFKMRYFNADGSEGEMCGNGARCISRFAYLQRVVDDEMTLETMAGIYEAEIVGENVRLKFPPVSTSNLHLNQSHEFEGETLDFHYAHVGVPHVVIYRDDVDTMDYEELLTLGRKIRYADIFHAGTNVNFLKIVDENNIIVRTYERGVEDETFACGTGSTASAITSCLLDKTKAPVNMHTRAGILKICFNIKEDIVDDLYMEGNAKVVAEGYLLPDAWR
ncbi:MAG: diaminopimelate epimerase [Tepidanaerobacteraceae bacterium]|nr:diaminopimelate epimerase [Tepidanaerobacteraceae bacterium]